MALITCHECGNQVSTTAKACPQCGGIVPNDRIASRVVAGGDGNRRVSVPLIIGIVLMPYIFVWLLFRQGYSRQARIVGFVWLGFLFLVVALTKADDSGTKDARSSAGKVDVDPNRVDKNKAAYLAKHLVPSALKDPSSAEFGRVWGMSATVACGFVNGKNGFGAMTGQTRFIFNDGRVSFENGAAGFARQWNATCVDKPQAPPPTGAGGIRWGARPPSSLKQYAPATDGLAVYVPKTAPAPLEGGTVAEAGYNFDHGRLFGADFYIDGEAGRDAILAAYVKRYGTPQAYDENAGSYSWKWPGSKVSVSLNYNAASGRTIVSFNHD